MILGGCKIPNNYDSKILTTYKDSVLHNKIIEIHPFRWPILDIKHHQEYISIYADSIEGAKGLDYKKIKSSFCSLSKNDLIAAEYLYRKGIYETNSNRNYNRIFSPDKYVRQYISFRDRNNDLIVWINSYYADKGSWMDHFSIYSVNDGGSYYFVARLNLTKMKVIYVIVNGGA